MSWLFIFFTFLNLLYISSFKGYTCRKLSSANDVQIWPDNCVLYNQSYASICSFSCPTGKQISGPSSALCGIRGDWNEDVNEVSCNGSYNSNFCFLLLFTLRKLYVFLLIFQAGLKNNGEDAVRELRANAQKNPAKSENRGHSSKPNLPSLSVRVIRF